MRVMEALGRVVGGILSPLVALGGLARNARLFHPDGVVYWAQVRPLATGGAIGELARRLEGPALVRFSGALWRHEKELPDLLGVAIKFLDAGGPGQENAMVASERDQDLLFATVRRIVALPIAPLTTNVHDYLANDYHALLPFFALGIGRVKFRLMPMRLQPASGRRRDKLAARATAGLAVLRLEVKKDKWGSGWHELASIEIEERALLDQELLEFNPFRSGRGIAPVGPIQMIRAATYPASVVGRRVV